MYGTGGDVRVVREGGGGLSAVPDVPHGEGSHQHSGPLRMLEPIISGILRPHQRQLRKRGLRVFERNHNDAVLGRC
jgi:hypothetical protein